MFGLTAEARGQGLADLNYLQADKRQQGRVGQSRTRISNVKRREETEIQCQEERREETEPEQNHNFECQEEIS